MSSPRYTNEDKYTQLLADSPSIDWDARLGPVAVIELRGDRTLAPPTNAIDGQSYALIVEPSEEPFGTLAFDPAYRDSGGARDPITPLQRVHIEFIYDSATGRMNAASDLERGAITHKGGRLGSESVGRTVRVPTHPVNAPVNVGLPDPVLFDTGEDVVIHNRGGGLALVHPVAVADYAGDLVIEPYSALTLTKDVAGHFTYSVAAKVPMGAPSDIVSLVSTGALSGVLDIGPVRIQWGEESSTVAGAEVFDFAEEFAAPPVVQATIKTADTTVPIVVSSTTASSYTVDRAAGPVGDVDYTWLAIGLKP